MSEQPTEAQADFDDALARAFAAIEGAKKDTKGARSKYASLAATTEAIKAALTKEHFSWPQLVTMSEGAVVVTTQLRRKGLYIESVLPMPLGNNADAQAVGSAITYGRRYALAAITGVAPEDDDGEAAKASGAGPVQSPREGSRKVTPAEPPARKPPRNKAWQAGHALFAKVSTRRDKFLAQNREALTAAGCVVLSMQQLVAKALGVEGEPPHRYDIPAEQWDVIVRAFGDDIDDMEMTIAEPEEAAQ